MPEARNPARDSHGVYPALSLYQLIGAPLHALVDAESQSAQATAEFIERFGFEPRAGKPAAGSGAAGLELGDLRMARFRLQRAGPDGTPRDMQVEVPLLSLLPVPALQIQDAELEFFVKIVDVASYHAETAEQPQPEQAPGGGDAASDAASEPRSDLDRLSERMGRRVEFKGALGRPGSTRVDGRQSMEMQVHVKVRVAQADVPAGMARLFNLLEHNIQVREAGELPTPEAPPAQPVDPPPSAP